MTVKTPNPMILDLMATIITDLFLKFLVEEKENLGIISNNNNATNSKEKISNNLFGKSKAFEKTRPCFKDLVRGLLHFASNVSIAMEKGNHKMDDFETNDKFLITFIARMILDVENFKRMLPNLRLNGYFEGSCCNYEDSTLLFLLYGDLELSSETKKQLFAACFAGYLDGDGCLTYDSLRTVGYEDNGNFVSQGNENYPKKHFFTSLEEIKGYLEENLHRIHHGHAPKMTIACSTNHVSRTSAFANLAVELMNKEYGHPRGGVFQYANSNKLIHEIGFINNGNELVFYGSSENGDGPDTKEAKLDFLNDLSKYVIIKFDEVENMKKFHDWRYFSNRRAPKEVEFTENEKVEMERNRREALLKDKELKEKRNIVKYGDNEEFKRFYTERFETANVEDFDSFPFNSVHRKPIGAVIAGMAMADGCLQITKHTAIIAQTNESYVRAMKAAMLNHLGLSDNEVNLNTRIVKDNKKGEERTKAYLKIGERNAFKKYLVAVGFHFSHRRDQVLTSLVSNLIRGYSSGYYDFYGKLDELVNNMNEERKAEYTTIINKWNKDTGLHRAYNDGYLEINEIESFLPIFQKVLDTLLELQKVFDPS